MIQLRRVMKSDPLLDLDIRADQYKYGVDPKRLSEDAYRVNNDDRTCVFVICNNDLPVGMIEYCDEDDLQCYNILYLFIDRRYQRKGYGYEAMRLIIEILRKDKKYNKVSVTLYEGNDAAQKLYEKIGFRSNGFVFQGEYDMEMLL